MKYKAVVKNRIIKNTLFVEKNVVKDKELENYGAILKELNIEKKPCI